ncbi:MAG: glycosyltransferase family A protein [Thermoanaerobaculia bacterium]
MNGDRSTTTVSPRGTPRLTIVIPTVNRASLVGRALDSALAQTYPDVEIIVSNNGSTDGTRAVLDRFAGAPRVRVLHRDSTIPANPHGNFLLEEARGEFFVGLSDDDWLEPGFAASAVAMFDRQPGLSFVWTGCDIHYADIVVPARTGPTVESGTEFLSAFLAGFRNICWCACVTRTADLRRIGPIPTDVFCGDMFYWTKLASGGLVGCVQEPLSHYVCYRDGGDGIAGGAPVVAWAAEMKRWATDMVESCEGAGLDARTVAAVRREALDFVARSTSNQFAWNALRGARKASLLGSVSACFPFLRGGHLKNWIRVVASIVAPKWLLRSRILAEARRRAMVAHAPER